jgi:prepilin-type N-terminal cleavage/methylation domain-containing protein
MRKPQFQNKAARGAFTLIEILVVLVIMGFLVSMVAPKLAGITDTAIDTVCDTNQQRLRAVMAAQTKRESHFPAPLTNMVLTSNTDSNNTFAQSDAVLPSKSDDNIENGAEDLSSEFTNRWLPTLHFLNANEASELKTMVGSAVTMYALVDSADAATVDTDTDGFANAGTYTVLETNYRQPVRNTLPVMMIGAGIAANGTTFNYATGATVTVNASTVTVDESTNKAIGGAVDATILASGANYDASNNKTFTRIAEAPMALRILMGLSNRNGLVTSGLLDEAGICPGAIKAADQFSYGNYLLILPRLGATVTRFLTAASGLDNDSNANRAADLTVGSESGNVVVHAVNFNEEDDGTFTLGARTPVSPALSGVNLVAQHENLESVTTSCPEGHAFGEISDWFGAQLAVGTGRTVK